MNEGAQRLKQARIQIADEAQWFKSVVNAMAELGNRPPYLPELNYWGQIWFGFDNMPPPSKRKWLMWAQHRAAAGDQRFVELFTMVAVMRLTE